MCSVSRCNRGFRRALCALVLCLYMAGFFPVGGFSGFGPGKAEAAPWNGTAEKWTVGDGSIGSPYEIATAEQLAYLAQKVNSDDERYSGKYFKLTADIDLGGHDWTPIGVFKDLMAVTDPLEKYFGGTFDGGGHVVSGMRIVSDNYEPDRGGATLACSDT